MPGFIFYSMKSKSNSIIFQIFFPPVTAICIFLLIIFAYYLFLEGIVSFGLWLLIPLPFILGLEYLSQKVLVKNTPSRFTFIRNHPKYSFIAAMIFWSILYYILVYRNAGISVTGKHAHFIHSYAPYFITGILKANYLDTLLLSFAWVLTYYFLTVRTRSFRLFSTILLPILLFKALMLFHVYNGGIFTKSLSSIIKQEAIELVFCKKEIISALKNINDLQSHLLKPRPKSHPLEQWIPIFSRNARDIFPDNDEGGFSVTFGNSFFRPLEQNVWPFVIRKNLSSGQINYKLWYGGLQSSAVTTNEIILAPWESRDMFLMSRLTLLTEKEIRYLRPHPGKGMGINLEPMTIVKDIVKDIVYMTTENTPGLFEYDIPRGVILRYYNFAKAGVVKDGGSIYTGVQSPTTRMIYLTATPGDNDIIEFDPDKFIPLRTLNLNDVGGTALAIDDEGKFLYFQSGYNDTLYKIDIATFKVVRKYDGSYHARRLLIDREYNCIYVLGYFSGTVFALDLKSGDRKWTLNVGGHPHGMALTDNYLWVHSMTGAFRINLSEI
jgi:hypothetical protein